HGGVGADRDPRGDLLPDRAGPDDRWSGVRRGEGLMGKDGMGSYTVGLDIGGTKILGALLDPAGEVVATVRRPTVHGAEGLVTGAAEAVRDVVASGGVSVPGLAGVGLGIPGIVDHHSGSARHALHLGLPD